MKRRRATITTATRVDFQALADKYPTFATHVLRRHGKPTINWRNPLAVRELNFALLDHHYDLKMDIPSDQLCPTVFRFVTLRVNYINWLDELIGSSDKCLGLDIGTGASCIYPLLGVRLKGWAFVGTDIDEVSLKCAQTNIERNNMESSIELRKSYTGQIFRGIIREVSSDSEDLERFDFTMCNPPFFDDLSKTGVSPRTVCPAQPGELVTTGGEEAFVGQMILESLTLQNQVRWYTTMLGRKASLKPLQRILRERSIVNVRTTEFIQGRTTRWGLAWSFTTEGLADFVASKVPRTTNISGPIIVSNTSHHETVINRCVEALQNLNATQIVVYKLTCEIKGCIPLSQEERVPLSLNICAGLTPDQWLVQQQVNKAQEKEKSLQCWALFRSSFLNNNN